VPIHGASREWALLLMSKEGSTWPSCAGATGLAGASSALLRHPAALDD
jgi:hypothetical protein